MKKNTACAFKLGGFIQSGLYNNHGKLSGLLASGRTGSQAAWGVVFTLAWCAAVTFALTGLHTY